MEETKLPPGQEWSSDAAAWRFVRVSDGAAYWLDPVKPRALSAGEVLVLAPAVRALVRASQLNTVVLHGFAFLPELLCGFLTLAERRFFESPTPGTAGAANFLPTTHPLAERFAVLVTGGEARQGLVYRAEVLGWVAAFFSEFLASADVHPESAQSARDRFLRIICQMPDLEVIHHSPEQLARFCGCSARHFNRLFREHFGESPRARQRELRLLRARLLLSASEDRIPQIALDSGYRSLSLFNSLFKRRFGMSPTEWRAQAARGNGRLF